MKKLFFFRSSGNGTDKQVHCQKTADSKMKTKAACSHADQEFDSPKSHVEAFGGPALRRSLSWSSAGFLFDKSGETSTNELNSCIKSQDRRRNHSSRCFTPERQVRERQCEADKLRHDSSGSSSSCSSTISSKVLDRYIDGEEHLEQCKQNSCSSRSDVSGSINRRRLPPRAQWTLPTSPSDTFNEKRKSQPFREIKGTRSRFSSADCVENGSRLGSPRTLARNVIERLSQTNGKSKGSNHEPITIQDVYGGSLHRPFDSSSDVPANVSLAEHYEPVDKYYAQDCGEQHQHYIRGKNIYKFMEDDMDSELEMKIKEAEKRAKLFSEGMEQQRCLSDCDFDVSSLVGAIRKLEEERLNLAFENINLLRCQMAERGSAREEIRWIKSDWDLHIQRLEKEKSELQADLEKELDRRSGEWTSKLEKFQLEDKKLRDRVRELAEHNVSLQRELSAFHENEMENKDMITHLERRVAELTTTADELHEENSSVKQTLSQLQERYAGATEDLDFLRRNFEEKDQECRELHKSVTKFLRTCKEQEKTIEGLRVGVLEEGKKQPLEKLDQLVKKLQVEQIRLTGIELSLRREIESMKLETDSLRHENISLLNRLKANGQETDIKLENELKMRVCYLQDQGLSMLNESSQLCYKILKFIKGKLTQFPEPYQDTNSAKDGLSEQFMIESEMKVHGIRRGTENLKRSLQTVTSVVASNSEPSCSSTGRPKEQRNQSVEYTLRAELKTETLITSLLREKLYSKEQEIEQLQAELATAVRGNEILRCEVQRSLDNLSVTSHELKDLKHQMLKKDESINRLESKVQEAERMNALLPKLSGERDQIWRELGQCCEKNMLLNSENETLKGMVEKLEEKVLEKEGEITIIQDTIRNKHLNLLSSPDFLV